MLDATDAIGVCVALLCFGSYLVGYATGKARGVREEQMRAMFDDLSEEPTAPINNIIVFPFDRVSRDWPYTGGDDAA